MTLQDIFNKVSGKLQYKVWKLGRKKITITRDVLQQHDATSDPIQFKFWDPRRHKSLTKKGNIKAIEQLQHKVWDPRGLKY